MKVTGFPEKISHAIEDFSETLRSRDFFPLVVTSSDGYFLLKWEIEDTYFVIEVEKNGDIFWEIRGTQEDYAEMGHILKKRDRMSILSDLEEFLNC